MSVARVNAAFCCIWLLLFVFSFFYSYDDPSSIFFNAGRAYRQRFSNIRTAEAAAYIHTLPSRVIPIKPVDKLLCIGIPSINRTTESFLASTVATLSDTLTPDERASIHIVVLLADKSPSKHFAYNQDWLEPLVDEVLLYGEPPERSTKYRQIPFDLKEGNIRGNDRVENMRLDHSALVEACRQQEYPYFALVEDDIVTMRDWYPRFKKGLAYVEKRTEETTKEWIYLRLFYSEILMGWNNEEWLSYSKTICLVYTIVLIVFLAGRKYVRIVVSTSVSPNTQRYLAALIFGLWLPALIALYFLTGRLSVNRLNPFGINARNGAREMPHYGCCAQGLVLPQRHLEDFQALLRDPPYNFPGDMILEGYAEDRGLVKWALEPSVFQHVGFKESSDGTRRAEVWNFGFERQSRI
ncbi:integral membrane [Trichoderma arundinaceum]|uniref:Integral membrane n=1 Tax=Trichoderma arundinaceum TaxID=490622 RepID=A0A395NUC9_TRIAR|nr:integral membrane [Trichoderma arundinaceum]